MTGNTSSRSKLEGILENVSKTDTKYLHRLMQVSLSAYLLETVGFDRGYGEYWLTIDNRMKKNRARESKWPADLILSYYENGSKIIEIIEVETRIIERYGDRFVNLKHKERRANKAAYLRDFNKLMSDADEVRFSVAMNASRISDADLYRCLKGFVDRFDELGNGIDIKEHNIYLLRSDLSGFISNNRHREKDYIKRDLSRSLDDMYSKGIASFYTAISWAKARSLH